MTSCPDADDGRRAPAKIPKSAFASVRGTAIHYLDWQETGRPVVILHGNTHAGGVYSPLGARLSSAFRVVAVDLRGHGLSDKAADYSWVSLRDDILGLIDQLDLRDVLLVAHSRGAGVGMLVAAATSRVQGLVAFEPTMPERLIDPTQMPADQAERLKKRLAQAVGRRRTFRSREAAHEHYVGRGAFKQWKPEYLHAFIRHCLIDVVGGGCELASPEHVEGDLVRDRSVMDAWTAAGVSETPMLAVYGERSGRLGGDGDPFAAIRRIFPNSRCEVMAAATHSGPMEQPEVFESHVREFERLMGSREG